MHEIIDLSINLGNLLTIASFLVGGIVFVMMIKATMQVIDVRLSAVEDSNIQQNLEIKKLADILVTLGRYEERFLRMENMIDDIRRGRGFIEPRN